MPRLIRIAGSFAITVIVYWAYWLVAVPWIEPPADPHGAEQITAQNRQQAAEMVNRRLRQIEDLFPPGALDPKKIKMLGSDDERVTLLCEEYKNFPDGRLTIDPCIIVFRYEGAADDEAQRHRQSIILEAPKGAVLQFDQPLDLNRATIGRLKRGQLNGQVTIRSAWKEPGPEDDLLILTRDVQLTEKTVFTPNPVDFRWGPHFGRGRDMLIKLLAGKPRPGMERSGLNIAGIESFELRHVERLHLDLGQAMAGGKGGQSPFVPSRAEAAQNVPVEINCRGPFRFDVVKRVATFRDAVEVMVKENPVAPADQIACDLLSLYFTQRPKDNSAAAGAKAGSKAANSFDLMAQRLEARGNPAVVSAPSRNVTSCAQRFQYDLLANAITLDGGREVFLQQGPNEITARSLCYKSAAEPGRLGQVLAQGPGRLRGQAPDRPDQQLEAVWRDQLRIEPDQGKQCIWLTGGAELNFPGVGQLQAQKIFFWFVELPAATDGQAFPVRPDGLVARNDVHMNTPQLNCKVDELKVLFKEGAGVQGTGVRGQGTGSRGQGSGERPGTAVPGMTAAAVQTPPSQNQPAAMQRFEITGRSLQARVLLEGQQAAVSNLTIEDGVRFVETQTSLPGERPLLITGDRLVAENLSAPNATVTISGRQTRFDGRGLGLTGSNINLDRGASRLWVEGPGQMDLPLSKNVQGQALTAPGVLTVDWQRRMVFDGRTARFEQQVVAAARQVPTENKTMDFQLGTETMEVQLQRPVSFSQTDAQAAPEVEMIRCTGGVTMEERTFDRQQQLNSHEQTRVTDLAINLLNGALNAGPGWLNSVYRSSANPLAGGMGATAGSPGSAGSAVGQANHGAPIAANPDQLYCLHIAFQREAKGNLRQRQLTFSDRVQVTYAPVDNWDAMLTTDDPDKLGPQGVVARCDQLSVVQMLLPVGGRRAIELKAEGNTVVENTQYIARGHQITYAEDKGLLILRGDGRSDAELFQQAEPGAPTRHTAFQEIYYWPKTNTVKAGGVRSLQIGQFPNGNGQK